MAFCRQSVASYWLHATDSLLPLSAVPCSDDGPRLTPRWRNFGSGRPGAKREIWGGNSSLLALRARATKLAQEHSCIDPPPAVMSRIPRIRNLGSDRRCNFRQVE